MNRIKKENYTNADVRILKKAVFIMVMEFISKTILHAIALQIYTAMAILIGTLLLIQIVKKIIQKKGSELLKSLMNTFLPFLYTVSLYASLRLITISASVMNIITRFIVVLLYFFAAKALIKLIRLSLYKKIDSFDGEQKTISGIMFFVQMIVWLLVIILLLDYLGVSITSIVAGLGISGIAVAIAAQAILGDLFSYISILLDKPFEKDDFIIIGTYMGTVEHIGLKTTRIRALDGDELIYSNTNLISEKIRNFKRMQRRRIVFRFGVEYGTSSEQLEQIPKEIQKIIGTIERADFDRTHFFSFGDFSLVFEVVYYVNHPEYTLYMDIQQKINLGMKKVFEEKKIKFAYPTQTVLLSSNTDDTFLKKKKYSNID